MWTNFSPQYVRHFGVLNTPQNRPLIHLNRGWGLWPRDSSKVPKSQRSEKASSLKMFFSISRPNVNGLKFSIHQFKGLPMSVKIRYCRLKSMPIWQQDGLLKVGHMVHKMAILFCYCLLPFVLRISKNERSVKPFFSISRPNLNGF